MNTTERQEIKHSSFSITEKLYIVIHKKNQYFVLVSKYKNKYSNIKIPFQYKQ